MASRFSIARMAMENLLQNTSASVSRRCLAAIGRSRITCASVLCGWAAPIRYIGMLEPTNINPGTSLDFAQGLIQVSGGERVLRTAQNRLQLCIRFNRLKE